MPNDVGFDKAWNRSSGAIVPLKIAELVGQSSVFLGDSHARDSHEITAGQGRDSPSWQQSNSAELLWQHAILQSASHLDPANAIGIQLSNAPTIAKLAINRFTF